MGYTHYWTYNPNQIKDTEELRKKFNKAVKWIQEAYKHTKKEKTCVIKGGFGQGTPMINESQVWFNGDNETEMDHETFDIKWYPDRTKDFCKTARKPYDILVCFSLLAFKTAFDDPNVFKFSSDGDNSDWEEAKKLFMDITYIHIDNIFPEEAHLEVA